MLKKFYNIDQCYNTFIIVIYTTIGITNVKVIKKYADNGINYAKKCFIILTPCAKIIKLFS
jgi:hypothetical protein